MPISITYPKAPDVPREMPLLAAVRPNWTRQASAKLVTGFGLDADLVDAGPWLVARDDRAALEIYQNSHSFRYERLDLDGEGRDGVADDIDDDRAIAIAGDVLARHRTRTGILSAPTVSYHEVLVAERDVPEPTQLVVGLQVHFRINVDGFDVLGPGAKAKVVIGRGGEVREAYRFWREVRFGKGVATISPDVAFERFAASDLVTGLDSVKATCDVTDVRLGYLSQPPTEAQGALLPAYELRGVLESDLVPRYEFTSYVLACELDSHDAKWAGRVGSVSERAIG